MHILHTLYLKQWYQIISEHLSMRHTFDLQPNLVFCLSKDVTGYTGIRTLVFNPSTADL